VSDGQLLDHKIANEFVMDRVPYPFIQMNPDDMTELKVKQGDLVEVYNDNGSTQAMVYPTPTAKRKQTFMLFAYPTGVQGSVVSAGVNEFIIPKGPVTEMCFGGRHVLPGIIR
jgi:arsenite oxidase large subunit